MIDEALRRAALDAIAAIGHDLAREALERGILEIEPDAVTWEGTAGTMHGDVVVLRTPAELAAAIEGAPSANDALARAIGTALAAREGRSLYDLRIEVGEREAGSPYRG